jgi:hypothetical protein
MVVSNIAIADSTGFAGAAVAGFPPNAENPIEIFDVDRWDLTPPPAVRDGAIDRLESGGVLFLPALRVEIAEAAWAELSRLRGRSKNISYDPATGRLGGTEPGSPGVETATELLRRFSTQSVALIRALFPDYAPALRLGRASFRPAEMANRNAGTRSDDTRLHVDAFPSRPTGGDRILRVFANINPVGEPRIWQVGEPFARAATRFAGVLREPPPGMAALLAGLGITKGRRTAYDALMLQLHDRMKADDAYQATAPRTRIEFPPGTCWIACSDQVLHAALAGRYMIEQTLHLPVAAQRFPDRSPLRVLERLKGHRLA